MADHNAWAGFYGPNAGYALELYERYQEDPGSVEPATRAFFDQLSRNGENGAPTVTALATAPPVSYTRATETPRAAPNGATAAGEIAPQVADVARAVGAARLARSIREYGHMAANIDPLGAARPGDPMLNPETHHVTDTDLATLPASIVWSVWRGSEPSDGTCLDAINELRAIYSGTSGYDLDHVQDFVERAWLLQHIEQGTFRAALTPAEQRELLQRLTMVEEFERFLHTTFQGQKRFSIEGCDALVPMLDELIQCAAETGIREVLIGMAHRGRLNVLAHVLGKPYAKIFSEFHHAPQKALLPSEGSSGITRGWTGDVKYHLGARRTLREHDLAQVALTLADNPSHLEFVNPVIEGFTRAAQENRAAPGVPAQDVNRALAVAIHGDAAFPGEGIVAETLNLSNLPGYATGGTIHIIANNQIGFTTGARDARSTLYASDLAKGFEIPIVHVNADDPEACLAAVRLALAYREVFHRDFLIDLVGYRRWGHNEGDEPSFTQPRLYAAIADHPTVRAIYAETLSGAEVVTPEEADALRTQERERLQQARRDIEEGPVGDDETPLTDAPAWTSYQTAVDEQELRTIVAGLLQRPDDFTPHPRLERQLQRRQEVLDQPGGIDWGLAESLAFGSLLIDGVPIRLTGQDSERGTFSHRHLVLNDTKTGARYAPLQALPGAEAPFAIYNSPLSEAAAIGFEYGYSVHAPETLVIWEAQYGDFANAGQVLIDQFIAAARAKWRKEPALVFLLPHGYEGSGPEHSSARLERYLQLAAEDNLRVANPTTAAQYFHLLRLQAMTLADARRPLVIMTPKSLLRHPSAACSLADLTSGGWQPVLDDRDAAEHRDSVTRLILCSGKVAIDLLTSEERTAEHSAVVRLEQLYPFPHEEVAAIIDSYAKLREVVWLQEEPQNMGAWSYIMQRLPDLLVDRSLPLRYIGRPEHASPAEGNADAHTIEQARIVAEAFAAVRRSRTRRSSNVRRD